MYSNQTTDDQTVNNKPDMQSSLKLMLAKERKLYVYYDL